MRIITPVIVDDTKLTGTNVAEDDAPAWDVGTTYAVDDQVVYDHRVYISLTGSNTGNQPDQSPTDWNDEGATNRYKAFDDIVETQTENTGSVEFTITPGEVNNGVALLNVQGSTAQVIVTDPIDGEVYNRTVDLLDETAITDWFAYFFNDQIAQVDVTFLDLPQYRNADIKIVVDSGAGTAKIGVVVIGKQVALGVTDFGSSVSIVDFTRKEQDDFGNFIVVERGFSKRGNFDVSVETPKVAAVQRALASVRATPTLYIGDDAREETIVYGFYRNFDIVLSNPAISDCTIEVEGLT